MLDPAHGGSDAGLQRRGVQEKDVTARVVARIQDELNKAYDVEARVTRVGDEPMRAEERVECAQEWNADCLVSVHVTSDSAQTHGSFIHPGSGRVNRFLQQYLNQGMTEALDQEVEAGETESDILSLALMPAILTISPVSVKENESVCIERVVQAHVRGLVQAYNLQRATRTIDPPGQPVACQPLVYDLVINGRSLGAFAEEEGLLQQIQGHIGWATTIQLERVRTHG